MLFSETEDSAVAHCEHQHLRKKEPPPIEWLREQIAYDPETGKFKWKVARQGRTESVGHHNKKTGYIAIGVTYSGRYHLLKASRLAFALTEGRWPNILDHINGDKADDRWCNLREVTFAGNCRNLPRSKRNTSGVTGVTWHKNAKKWQAHIGTTQGDKRLEYLGLFDTKEEAIAARKEAEKLYGYHENHGREPTEPSKNE